MPICRPKDVKLKWRQIPMLSWMQSLSMAQKFVLKVNTCKWTGCDSIRRANIGFGKLQRRIRKLPGPRIRKLAVPRIRKLQRRIRKLPGPRIRKLRGPRIRKLPGPRIRKLPGPRIRKLADPPGFGNFSVGFGNFQALGFGNLPIPPDSETSTSDSENTRGSDSETCLSPRIRKLQRRIRQLPGPRIRKLCHRQTASLYIGFLDDQPFGWHH